jgi:NADH:ubiquinone oxidoreductase subunit F (NADH-binding)
MNAPDTERRLTLGDPIGADLDAHVDRYGPAPAPQPGRNLEEIKASGLRGRGGGWFPTAQKMQAVLRNAEKNRRRPVVVCNAMEGEPAASSDARLVQNRPHLVIDGVEAAAHIVGARKAYIALHEDAPQIDVLKRALAQRPDNGIRIQITAAPARYVASEESALARFISSGVALPVYGTHPYERGVRGRATLVNNAETLALVGLIVRYGAAWFRSVGLPDAPGTTLVSVGGDVGQNVETEIATGTPIADIIASAGGVTGELTALRTGGFGGTWGGPELMSLTWDPDALRARGIAVGSGILWALSTTRCGLVETALTLDYLAGESAGQCGVCAFGLSSIATDMNALAARRADADTVSRLTAQLAAIPRRGGCALPDGAVRMTQSAMQVFTDEVSTHMSGDCSAPQPPTGVWTPIPATHPHPVTAKGRHFQ